MEFSPAPSPMIMHAYYGLSAVMTPQIGAKQANKQLQEEQSPEYIHLRIPRKAIRYSVAVLVLGFVVGLPLSLWQPNKDTFSASVAPPSQEVTKAIEHVRREVKKIQQEEPVATPSQASVWTEAQAGTYYLIIGTEKHQANAERYIKLYQDKFPKLQVLSSKKLYRISAESFTDKTEASNRQRALAKEGISSWIYIP